MNPFEKNLSELSDSELEQNLNNLTGKYFLQYRRLRDGGM
jgi:ribosomal protein L29